MEVPAPAQEEQRLRPSALAWAVVVPAFLWTAHRALFDTNVLATWRGREALSPLYAFWEPLLRPEAAAFVIGAVILLRFAVPLCDPARVGGLRFALFLGLAGLALPLLLFDVRQDPVLLGTQLDHYAHEEFVHDARRILDVPGFLDRYVETMPGLSLHGRHFPPGHALLLHLFSLVAGPGLLAVGLLAVACTAAGLVGAWLGLRQLVPERGARQGALLLLAAPSFLDFACTSMDGVFLLFASLAWWLSLRALAPGAPLARSALAGAALLVASGFSFSALPLGLCILLHGLLGPRAARAHRARSLLVIGATFAACAVVLDAGTGFALWDCFAQARRLAEEQMARASGADPAHLRGLFTLGNVAAFATGAGAALLGALASRAWGRADLRGGFALAAGLALLVMAAGGMHFLETERIWLYALPWLAAVAAGARPWSAPALRILLAAGLLQALALEILLFTLW